MEAIEIYPAQPKLFPSLHHMLVRENFVHFEGSQLHYATAGNGTLPLLIFHGFGQDHQVFENWVHKLEKQYRLYIFDLYFHGQSFWPGERLLEKRDWRKIMEQFFQQENIEEFAVSGFSMGGKFAFATLEAFPEKTKKIILLAPDGIKPSFWYRLATSFLIRGLFKSMIEKPGRYYATVRVLRALRLVNKGVVKFAQFQMDTEEKRKKIYHSWVGFRHLTFSMKKIASLMNQHHIPLLLITGIYDKVIPVKIMGRLTNRLENKKFEILESGHNDLLKEAIPYLDHRF